MATIQIRNVPDDIHRTYQSRAALAGQSLQEYLLAQLIDDATHPTPGELIAEIERELAIDPTSFAAESSAGHIREDRTSH